MLDLDEITQILFRGKGIQRRLVVEKLFGSQANLARELGLTRSTVSHVVAMRRTSRRIEERVLSRIRSLEPSWIGMWAPDWRKNGKKKAA